LVKMNRESLPMNYERHTKAKLDAPITSLQLCSALLDPSEYAACQRERQEIIIKGHAFPAESPEINKDILSVIRTECLDNGDVTLRDTRTFSFARARTHIQNKFGLSGFGIVGNRNRIVAVVISSFVSYVDPEVHVKRYANIVRAVKAKYPHVHFEKPDCQTTVACDPKLTKALEDLISEKEPMQPKRVTDS
jgi:hypothetical protein